VVEKLRELEPNNQNLKCTKYLVDTSLGRVGPGVLGNSVVSIFTVQVER
jgi:hypothetical protein